jgi:hypothetical protein
MTGTSFEQILDTRELLIQSRLSRKQLIVSMSDSAIIHHSRKWVPNPGPASCLPSRRDLAAKVVGFRQF